MHFVTYPKQGREMEAVVLHRVGFLAYSCPKQGQDFKPSAAPLYPKMGQVPPPPGLRLRVVACSLEKCDDDNINTNNNNTNNKEK